MKIVLATNNQHKVEEINQILQGLPVSCCSLQELPTLFLKEEGQTLRENALQKARIVAAATQGWALGDDTGLFVEALEGRPGVYSSRYAGEKATFEENMEKLLRELSGVPKEKRQAVFQTVLALVHPDGREIVIDGKLEGVIAEQKRGKEGFGYDPVFYIPERHCTLAELSLEEKNKISHRGKALAKMKGVLEDWIALKNRQ